ncbi:hypothetical protein GCM10011578_009560 [Streptomyces fuscichromogenes]|uniref:Uncharacterized protein n=1 Tax=Streptomyces fuscichromogenes TaxID=1324013 RepID=A0A917UHQ6_9ACTN|nr:hypothetical protein GCM10011578_009560 [Streptomyces fuscichromogenes]
MCGGALRGGHQGGQGEGGGEGPGTKLHGTLRKRELGAPRRNFRGAPMLLGGHRDTPEPKIDFTCVR